MTDTTQYNQLLPLGDEESDDDWETKRTVPDMKSTGSKERAPEVEFKDNDPLIATEKHHTNGTEYNFSSRRKYGNKFCTPTRAALVFATMLICLGVGFLVGFLTPFQKQSGPEAESEHTIAKRSPNWRTKMPDWGTESCIRLVDIDGDGVLDIIIGLALGKDVSTMLTASTMDEFCRSNGLTAPCAGAIVGLRGRDGKLLWKADAYGEIFELLCVGVDVNKDGTDDCIASGRIADLRAVNPKNGEILWVVDQKYIKKGWNFYGPAAVQDLDGDGVGDIVISHGGDPTVAAEIHTRRSGRIMLISGATGRTIGTYLSTPNERETYMTPVIHQRADGSQYVLIGTGGETVDGMFMALSVPDFYRHVKGLSADHPVDNTYGGYGKWGFKKPFDNGTIEIYKSEPKGVMVPPVLIDMNHDGVKDILMSAFNGVMVLYDGETLEPMWKVKFDDRESYSSPAPGYFNDDDVIDFMVHWSVGAWPFYNTTDTVILDGRDGSVLWNLTTNRYDVSSDLVARTTAANRDVFLFRAQGRHGHDSRHDGAIHGASGVQRIINRRSTEDGRWEFAETEITDDNADIPGVLLPESHFRQSRAYMDKDYVECESDQKVFLAELFALDRTVMRRPIKLWQRGSEKYFYKLTSNDHELVKQMIKIYGGNVTISENEVPWSRGRRAAKADKNKSGLPFCVMSQPDDRTTGALGDVDGDGKLDLIVNMVSVGVIRDEYARYVKMKFDVEISKIDLESALKSEHYTPIDVALHGRMSWVDNENEITSLKFKPPHQQIWGGYMGTIGDNVYNGD